MVLESWWEISENGDQGSTRNFAARLTSIVVCPGQTFFKNIKNPEINTFENRDAQNMSTPTKKKKRRVWGGRSPLKNMQGGVAQPPQDSEYLYYFVLPFWWIGGIGLQLCGTFLMDQGHWGPILGDLFDALGHWGPIYRGQRVAKSGLRPGLLKVVSETKSLSKILRYHPPPSQFNFSLNLHYFQWVLPFLPKARKSGKID